MSIRRVEKRESLKSRIESPSQETDGQYKLQQIMDAESWKYFWQGFGIVVGVFFGVVAGTAINLSIDWWKEQKYKDQRRKNLLFECELNLQHVTRWLKALEDYRKAVVEDRILQFGGYFDLTRGLSQTASEMYRDGSLFEFLTHEDIDQLQGMYTNFTIGAETVLNNSVRDYRNSFGTQNYRKGDVTFSIELWEKRFKPHEELLESLVKKLS